MRKAIVILSTVFLLAVGAHAQLTLSPSVVASGGQYFEVQNMSISWTIGEIAVTTLTGDNLILTQGFQQPVSIGTGVTRNEFEGEIHVYPNPVQNELFVRFDIEKPGNYILELHDVTGRIIIQTVQKPINPGDIIRLSLSNYSPGIFFLKVQRKDGKIIFVSSVKKS